MLLELSEKLLPLRGQRHKHLTAILLAEATSKEFLSLECIKHLRRKGRTASCLFADEGSRDAVLTDSTEHHSSIQR